MIPSEKLAGLIAAAIISDTVMFKSPTCTIRDIRTAERMARYANISLNELGKKIFSASFEGKTVKELLFTDYKEFLLGEARYASLTRAFPDRAEKLFEEAAANAVSRYEHLVRLGDLYAQK